jgi:hypothetical protein
VVGAKETTQVSIKRALELLMKHIGASLQYQKIEGLKLNELNFPANNGKQLAVNLTKGEQENGI